MFRIAGPLASMVLTFSLGPARADVPNGYRVLGVDQTATAEQIKAQYRTFVKALRPDINTDAETVAKFLPIKDAYETLSDPARRARHDRELGLTQTVPPDPRDDEFRRFFAFDRGAGLPYSTVSLRAALRGGFVNADLRSISRDDVIGAAGDYPAWQKALARVVAFHRPTLRHLHYAQYAHTAGSRQLGRHGNAGAWFGLAFGAIATALPGDAATGLGVLALSPFVWQGLSYWNVRGDLFAALDRLKEISANILAAPSAAPLVNAVAAYDFVAATFDEYFDYNDRARAYPRLRRGWTLRATERDPCILEGWLLRALQADASNLTAPFFADLRGRPKLWREPLATLLGHLDGQPALQIKIQSLLRDLENQGPARTAVYRAKTAVGRACEYVLANADVLVRTHAVKRQ